MSVLSAQSIRAECLAHDESMIFPFHERNEIKRSDGTKLSFGLGACSYDARVDLGDTEAIMIMPHHSRLVSTFERFRLPNHIMAIVHDKSSWARRFLAAQNTLIDPGFIGYVTLELTNHGQAPITIRHGDPIVQLVFHWLDKATERPYDGKYQGQGRGPVEAR